MNKGRQTAIRITILILALTGIALYIFLGSVTVSVGKDSITVSGTLASDVTLHYSDIDEFELHNHMDLGICSFGLSTRKIMTGKYSSYIYGAYDLFAYKNISKFIMLKTDDTVIIFNFPTEEETVKYFEEISGYIQKTINTKETENEPDQ